MIFVAEVVDAGSVCDVSEWAPPRVLDLTASADVECDLPAVLSATCQLNLCASQTRPFSGQRGASGALLLCEQFKRARMNVEGPPVEAVPESMKK